MNPIGQTILLWRNERNLTQTAVAGQSGVSRPNLSAIEQGARDLTVQTLRRIAAVLGVSAGTLVDGITPGTSFSKKKFDRYALDRIARLAAGQRLRASADERRLAQDFASIMKFKTGSPDSRIKYGGVRSEGTVVARLRSELGPVLFDHLVRRIEKNLGSRPVSHE